jgi:hypothetical protein
MLRHANKKAPPSQKFYSFIRKATIVCPSNNQISLYDLNKQKKSPWVPIQSKIALFSRNLKMFASEVGNPRKKKKKKKAFSDQRHYRHTLRFWCRTDPSLGWARCVCREHTWMRAEMRQCAQTGTAFRETTR